MINAALIGATGLVGSNLLGLLINNDGYEKICIITRKVPNGLPQKVEHIPLN